MALKPLRRPSLEELNRRLSKLRLVRYVLIEYLISHGMLMLYLQDKRRGRSVMMNCSCADFISGPTQGLVKGVRLRRKTFEKDCEAIVITTVPPKLEIRCKYVDLAPGKFPGFMRFMTEAQFRDAQREIKRHMREYGSPPRAARKKARRAGLT